MPSKNTETKIEPIQAVERALAILELLSQKGSLGLNELHKELNVNKASVLRLAHTLVQSGYLSKNEDSGNYSLTLKPYEIGAKAIKILDKMTLISSALADLNSVTGRIAQFSIEDNNEILCLQSIGQKENLFSIYTNIGGRSPLYSTSAGKALLSSYTNTEILEKWPLLDVHQLTEHTITDVQEMLRDICLTRQRGYALDIEENEYNLFCVGTIVKDASSKPIGALSLSGNTLTETEENQLAQALLPMAKRLSIMMGYIPV